MRERENRNLNGKFVDIMQACEMLNLGRHTVRKLADEAGAAIKVGRCYRVNLDVLVNYISKNYSA